MFSDRICPEDEAEARHQLVAPVFRGAVNWALGRVFGGKGFVFLIQEGKDWFVVSMRELGIINFKAIHDGRLLTAKILDSLSKLIIMEAPAF